MIYVLNQKGNFPRISALEHGKFLFWCSTVVVYPITSHLNTGEINSNQFVFFHIKIHVIQFYNKQINFFQNTIK